MTPKRHFLEPERRHLTYVV